MSTLLRRTSLLIARAGLAVVVLSFTVFGIWTAGDLLGQAPAEQKPRVEEEEKTPKAKAPHEKARSEEKEDASKAKTPSDKKKKHVEEEEDPSRNKQKKRKVIRVEEEDDSKAKPTTNPPNAPASGDLNQLAEKATQPSIKKLFRSLAVPYDRVVFKAKSGVTFSGEAKEQEKVPVVPIPLYLGNNSSRNLRETIRYTPLTSDGKTLKPQERSIESLDLVWPYEEIAQDAVRRFLGSKTNPDDLGASGAPSKYEKLSVAEQVLSFVLRWHESARQTGKRSGREWAKVEASLRKQLLDDVKLKQMNVLVQAQEWDQVFKLAHHLAETYTEKAERERIFLPVAKMIKQTLQGATASDEQKQDARNRLRELERVFPGSGAFETIIENLKREAQSQREAAEKALVAKDEAGARRLLRSAREKWPESEGLDVLEKKLRREHPTLRVGVRGPLPRYFSPAWACTENERRAVDLLFESLVKLVPDGDRGFRYRLGLAESGPEVVPLGRRFELPRNARWSNGDPIFSTDIDFSMNLLKNGGGVGRSRVWGDLLEKVEAVEGKRDPFHLTISLKQGFLDPLALMTFKILHPDPKIDVNSEEFAKKPITSGPYRLEGPPRSDEADRVCLFFVANSSYGLRATKPGTPHIEKIHLYTYEKAVDELRRGKLDLVLDLQAGEAQELLKLRRTEGLPVEVPLLSSAVPNRRIYFLAINNHKLSDVNLRRALALAINRESLLEKHFRAGLKLHRVINGPFPAGSWACNEKLNNRPNKKGLDLFDPIEAKNRSEGLEKPAGLKLKYPQGDPVLDEAMKELCKQVKDAIEVELERLPCDPYDLRRDVEETQDYDLAYYHYDFPDEGYWLAPLLGPPPHGDEKRFENIFRFKHKDIETLLEGTVSFRNFAEVQRHQWQIHELLDKEMPFIPLWQLDPLLAYRRDVEPNGLDPCQVFSNIEEWRVHSR